MRRFSKPSTDRIASVRIDLLNQSQSDNAEEIFKSIVSSAFVIGAIEEMMRLLFGISACTIGLGGASVATQEIAVHVISAGGGGSGVDNGGVIGGIEQLRAACAMVTTVPASGVANRIMRKVSGGAVKDEPQEEDGEREVPTSGGDNADLIRPYLVGVGNGEFLAPCRLTVSKVK